MDFNGGRGGTGFMGNRDKHAKYYKVLTQCGLVTVFILNEEEVGPSHTHQYCMMQPHYLQVAQRNVYQ
jgi:hypothetical protein